MDDNKKKVLIVIVAIVAVAVAAFSGYKSLAQQEGKKGNEFGSTTPRKTGKQLEMEAMERNKAGGGGAPQTPAADPTGGK